MFSVNDFVKEVKSKYTNSISFALSKRVQNIINKGGDLYSLHRMCGFVDTPLIIIPAVAYTSHGSAAHEKCLETFEQMLALNWRTFFWFSCAHTSGITKFDFIFICSSVQEEEIYTKLLRYENLKAFL